MPRTSLTQRERKNNEVIGYIDRYKNSRLREGANIDDVAHALGFLNRATFYRRLKNPDGFTLGELHAMASVLNINIGTMLGEGAAV